MSHIICEIKKIEEWFEKILVDCKHGGAIKIKNEFYNIAESITITTDTISTPEPTTETELAAKIVVPELETPIATVPENN